MKTSFLKNFFNTKDMGPKSNFNIHSVDLDDSDDVIVCNESFFQRNNLQNSNDILKSKFIKTSEALHEKKANLFALNDSVSSCDMKSPMLNNFNLKKMRSSPLNSPLFDRDNSNKNKNMQEFVPPNNMSTLLKTPNKDDKIGHFQSINSRVLSSPSTKFFNSSNLSECTPDHKNKFFTSPNMLKETMSPSIAKMKIYEKDQAFNHNKISGILHKNEKEEKVNHSKDNNMFYKAEVNEKDNDNHNKISNMAYKNEMSDKYSIVHQRQNFIEEKNENEMETYKNINKNENCYKNQHAPLRAINDLFTNDKLESSSYSNSIDSMEVDDNKLKILHMKLKLESEKIQKWKDGIEKELVQKTKKISESDKIIESLRSSNLDLQMRQENISLNYKEEIECRSEVSKKIENSRQLCNILKEKISDIENVNENQIQENKNMKFIQDQILYVINFVSDDIKNFSKTQIKIITELKDKANHAEKELDTLTLNMSEQKKSAEIEFERYNSVINDMNDQILLEEEKCNLLTNEKDKCYLEKVEIQALLTKEKILNESILSENSKLIEEFSNLKILTEKITQENLNFIENIDAKENIVNQLNTTISELNIEHTKLAKEFCDAKIIIENSLQEKEKIIENLQMYISTKEKEINVLTESLITTNEDMILKTSLKDISIENLTKTILEKEGKILCLEDSISKLNEDIRKITESLNGLTLENDINSKKASLLKSSNEDLREELSNYKQELNGQSQEMELLKNNLIKLENNNVFLKEESVNDKKLICEMQDVNSSLKSDLDDLKIKLSDSNEINLKLKTSIDELNDTNKFLFEENMDEIKNITTEYNNLKSVERKLNLEMELKSKECNTLLNDLNIERSRNTELMQICEDLRLSMSNKLKDFTTITSEKQELCILNGQLSMKNEENDNKIKEYETLIAENKLKILSLEIFVDDLSKDKQNILKSREDLRKELMFTLEQCKNEHDVLEKKRNKEIDNLKAQINSLSNNSSNNTKKSKNKINELQILVAQQKEDFEDLKKEMKTIVSEKNTICKNFEMTNLSMKELTEEISLKDKLLSEIDLEKQNLKNILSEYESKFTIISKELINKNHDICKLKEIEMEYREMKNSIISNSPPMSTQVPDYIKTCGSATPKSQRLSSRLQSINAQNLDGQIMVFEKQTPQKTPKGILRQPGSASKRRKVIFEDSNVMVQNIDLCDDGSLLSDGVDIDFEDINIKNDQTSVDNSYNNFNSITTPKKINNVSKLNLTDSRAVGRLNNIRKTPSKAPSKLNDKRKKNDKNWFDSDNFFGVSEP